MTVAPAPPKPPDPDVLPVGGPLATALVGLGDWTLFSLRAVSGMFHHSFSGREWLRVAVDIGVNSLSVVIVTGLFIGMVLAVQTYNQFHTVGLETSLGAVIHLSVVRELGPVLSSVMLAGRVGGAMAAELATMRVSEQIDALACLGVDPVKHLVAPRFLACLLMIPMLTVFADVAGLVGCTIICLHVYGIDTHHYWEHSRNYVGVWDVFVGVAKAFVLGGVMALIACHRGFHSKAGAAGVGRAATQAFVFAFVSIIVLDFVLSMFANSIHDIVWPDAKSKVM
ncbi:MAG TPA: ABC transporter permease [Urbifossiella sp.]|nr:ABC transporter permease [Urbifossiella sp.]